MAFSAMGIHHERQLLLDFESATLPPRPVPKETASPVSPNNYELKTQIIDYLESRPGERIGLRELCRNLGHPQTTPADPLSNPVHQALKELRDLCLIECIDRNCGEPLFSALKPPSSSSSPSEIVCQGADAPPGEQTISPVEDKMETAIALEKTTLPASQPVARPKNRDEAKKLVDDGLKDLQTTLAAGHSDTLCQFLSVMSKFHKYSFGNVMLIAFQAPDATVVAGYRRWQQLGRQVKKGEKGICILAPLTYHKKTESDEEETVCGFRAVRVFDITQTDGKPLPELETVTGDAETLIPKLEAVAKADGIELQLEEIPGSADGYSAGGRIVTDSRLLPPERFSVLVHELAHERLHQGDNRTQRKTTHTVLETEAEAVSFVVCNAYGLDCSTHSSDYIQLHNGDTQVLQGSMDKIRKTASDIIEAINKMDV